MFDGRRAYETAVLQIRYNASRIQQIAQNTITMIGHVHTRELTKGPLLWLEDPDAAAVIALGIADAS